DIVEDAQALDEIELLIDHPHPRSVLAKPAAVELTEVLVPEADHAGAHGKAAREAPEEGRLARPRTSEDRHELPGLDDERDAIEGATTGKELADLVEDNHGRDQVRHSAGHATPR